MQTTNENMRRRSAQSALTQEGPLAEGAALPRKAWQAPELVGHGPMVETTGDQTLTFSGMAMSS